MARAPNRKPMAILMACFLVISGYVAEAAEAPALFIPPSAESAPALLPDRLGPFESLLWASNGLMRKNGLNALTPEARNRELKVRRGMLTGHMAFGIATVGLLVSTVVIGQNLIDRPMDRQTLLPTHEALIAASVSTYSITALLAAFSPPPMLRRREFSTTTLHRVLAFVHLAGMILTPILGLSLENTLSYNQLLTFHQIAGITTAAALTLSMLVLVF